MTFGNRLSDPDFRVESMMKNHGPSAIPSLEREFLVPDYYPRFQCKGASCRNACCSGWGVTIPRDQYYALLGLACGKRLRERLDRAFRPVLDPTPERFAEIVPTYEGGCPLRRPDGLCRLQASLGEEVLPKVCRYYPRGPRLDPMAECSCANSCEATLELLFATPEPLTFSPRKLVFDMPMNPSRRPWNEVEDYRRIRDFCFSLLQDRTFPLSVRILRVGKLLQALDADPAHSLSTDGLPVTAPEADLAFAWGILLRVSRKLIANSRSLADFGEEPEDLPGADSVSAAHDAAENHFRSVLPDGEILFEKMLVNHLFFRQFPFRQYAETLSDEFASLCGTYLFLRYLALVLMRGRTSRTDFVDLSAKAFRFIAHSRFEHNVLVLLREEGATDFDTLSRLAGV